jgi:hypothetical protein
MDYLIRSVGLDVVDNILGYVGQFTENAVGGYDFDADLNIIFSSKILYKKYFPNPDDTTRNQYIVYCDIIKFNGDIEGNIEKCNSITQNMVSIYKILSTAKPIGESIGFLN